jgi:23S rRNA G2445 N2-methylase RlmL
VRVSLHCRAGLERILAEELAPQVRARVVREGTGAVHLEASLRGAPADLLAARTLLSIGFPLDPVAVDGPEDEAIVAALTSPRALGILRRWTVGPIRYRIAFRAGGKHRATVWRVAAEVARRAPELVNDPTGSPWEAVVDVLPGHVAVELVPDVPDPRFAYRTGDVPAASHPTIAAALVRVAGAREDDVVWDPFVGSGTELCERALAGPYRALWGSDLDPAALAVAKANLEAAGVAEPSLFEGDATRAVPPGPAPTLIVTNPPLGRRVQRTALLAPMLDRFLAHASRVLAPEGRLSWISPFPERTRLAAERAGLFLSRAVEVDLGGFAVEMQLFRAPPAARRRR